MSTSILITAKINPDLDGVACAYAYSHFLRMQGKNVTGGVFGQMHAEAAYLIDRFGIEDVVHDPAGPFHSFILVDASDMAGMPSAIRQEDVMEIIDHREVHRADELFPNAKIHIERVGSAATLIAEKYRSSEYSIDPHSGILLFGAIYSNTLNFQASITTERDKAAADWLRTQVAVPTSLVDEMFAFLVFQDINEIPHTNNILMNRMPDYALRRFVRQPSKVIIKRTGLPAVAPPQRSEGWSG